MNKLSLVGMQLPEKYMRRLISNIDVSSEGPSNSRRRAFARNVDILLIYFQVVASLPTKAYSGYVSPSARLYGVMFMRLAFF